MRDDEDVQHVISAVGDLLARALASIDDPARASTARGEVYDYPCFDIACYSLRFPRLLLQPCNINMVPPPKGWRESLSEMYVKHVKGGELQSIGLCALFEVKTILTPARPTL